MSKNDSNIQFTDDFCDFAFDLLIENGDILFLGDFYIHVNNQEDVDAAHFLEMKEALGLYQNVKLSTHNQGTTLDFILSEKAAKVKIVKINYGRYISDHRMIMATLNIPSLDMKHKCISYCKLWNVKIEALLEDMDLGKINNDDMDEFLSHFEMNMTKSMNKKAPTWKKSKIKSPGIMMNWDSWH